MHFVDDVDLVTGLVGSIIDLLTEAPNILNAGVTGGINLNDIESPGLGNCLAHRTSITWLTLAIGQTIHCLSQNARRTSLTCSSWATKKIGVRYTASTEGIA